VANVKPRSGVGAVRIWNDMDRNATRPAIVLNKVVEIYVGVVAAISEFDRDFVLTERVVLNEVGVSQTLERNAYASRVIAAQEDAVFDMPVRVVARIIRDGTKHSEGEILTSFFKWLDEQDDLVVAGQNVFFDCDFLRDAAMRWNIPYFLSRRIIDLHSITYFHMIQRGITPPLLNRKTHLDSDKIMEYVGIPTEPKPHKAINGAVWEAEAFSRLLHNVSLFEQFQKYPILW
jgi:hypothetical protein